MTKFRCEIRLEVNKNVFFSCLISFDFHSIRNRLYYNTFKDTKKLEGVIKKTNVSN